MGQQCLKCVSGPVIRQTAAWDLPEWVQGIYTNLQAGLRQHKVEARLPIAEPELEQKEPREFFHAMHKRVSSSVALVSVFTSGDVSAAIEASMASVAGKKILVIAEHPEEVPRLVKGLPGLIDVLDAASMPEGLEAALSRLLSKRMGPLTFKPSPKGGEGKG